MRTFISTVSFALGLAASGAAMAANAPGGGNRLLMTTYWGDDVVALIDTQAKPGNEELWKIDMAKAINCLKPYDVRVGKEGSKAYVTCSGSSIVAVVDVAAQQVEYVIETGKAPRDLALFDNGQKLIVANSGSNTVSIVDLNTRKKLYDFPVAMQPYGVAVVADKTALITGWASGDLHIAALGPTSGKVQKVIQAGLLPYTVVAAPKHNLAFVAVNAEDRVTAVDLTTYKMRFIPVGKGPWSLAASADEKHILVTNNRSNSLSLLDIDALPAETGTAISFTAGTSTNSEGPGIIRRPKNGSISADGKTAAFTDLASDEIVVVELPSGKILRSIEGGKAPYGIEFLR